jgi:FMN phosphatase YigB (HAD superfamily)
MTSKHLPVKHLLVDLDGTLLGNKNLSLSYDFLRQAVEQLKVYGGVKHAAKILFSVGSEMRRTSKEFTNDLRLVEAFAKQTNLTAEEGRDALREGVMKIFPTLERHFYPIQGAKEFLDWAKAKYPLTLATNPVWPPEIIELRVKWAGIDPKIFNSITHVRKMHAYKPAPEYYSEILEQEGLDPKDCLLIGDNVKMDLPATRVGIRVFIVGPYKKMTSVKLPRQKAPAWKGSYFALRQLLESFEA